MDSKHTMLLFRTPVNEEAVPADTYVVRLNTATRQLDEYLPGQPIPRVEGANLHLYTVPAKPCESVFAVHGAITCTTPSGTAFRPGFCVNLSLSYISPLGLKTLLTASTAKSGYVPDCVTLEDLYNIAAPKLKEACEKAAEEFSQNRILSYMHWWQELNYGETFVQSLKTALIPLFNAYGFALDSSSVRITGVAGIPVS